MATRKDKADETLPASPLSAQAEEAWALPAVRQSEGQGPLLREARRSCQVAGQAQVSEGARDTAGRASGNAVNPAAGCNGGFTAADVDAMSVKIWLTVLAAVWIICPLIDGLSGIPLALILSVLVILLALVIFYGEK